MIGITSRATLNALQPNLQRLIEMSRYVNCNGYFVFTFDADPDALTHGRMFAPAIGIAEDPVTGNANGPLGGYLVDNRLVNFTGDHFEFVGRQGEYLNRTGDVHVRVDVENNQTKAVQIKGSAVIVFRTEIEL